jgi:diguanylate cyclase (GGDEF)-like protein/PAS domain S-box-containing protein
MESIKYKILLIEDDEADQAAFKRLIRKEGLLYDYAIAGSISDAKGILLSETFDAVIIDYKLNDGVAFDILDLIVGIPFIIITGAGDEEVAVKAMRSGAHDYLIKDIERNYLKVLPVVLEKAILNKKKEDHFRLISYAIMSINDSVYFTDMGNKVLFVNHAFYKTYGYIEEDIVGKYCDVFWESISNWENLNGDLTEVSKGSWCGEIYHRHKEGSRFPVYLSRSIIKDENERELGIVNVVRDITEKKAIEQRLKHMAHFDDLTGLPNRVLFYDHLNKLLIQAKNDNQLFAVLFLDLDRFKVVNDTLGHTVGDFLLKLTAKRLVKCIRDEDMLARLGGDEFAVILANINEPQNAATVAQRIIACLENPFRIKKDECTIGVSVGITLYPHDGDDADNLIKNADIAMYHAKGSGRNAYQFYDKDMNTANLKQFTMENKLREAIKQEEFLLHYQPQVDTKAANIIGIEAMIRWQPSDHEMISPDKFIPISEETGLIIPIGEWVLRTACRQNKAWQDMGLPSLPISVNVSGRQFKQPNFVEIVIQVLEETGLDPHFLEIELTESILMHDEVLALTRLEIFAAKGIKLAIDDFGIGYSSMRYLKRLPIHKLKIDKSFIDDIVMNPNDRAISEAIITMAHSLQIKVIAEGVETKEQMEILRSLGCDEIQGYLFFKPMPSEKIVDIFSEKLRKMSDEK